MIKQCPRCEGLGVVEKSDEELIREEEDTDHPVLTKPCPRCGGIGQIGVEGD